jgi:hypothetical protein
MHNWFEGVLQHHFRYRWGLNGTPTETKSELDETDFYTTENDDLGDDILVASFWSDAMKKKLITAVLEVVVPTGMTRMPRRFGAAKNGKLKASEWHALFAIHLPLASLDVFIGRDIDERSARNLNAIKNICALVRCTHNC